MAQKSSSPIDLLIGNANPAQPTAPAVDPSPRSAHNPPAVARFRQPVKFLETFFRGF
jgi:hypothetical protein